MGKGLGSRTASGTALMGDLSDNYGGIQFSVSVASCSAQEPRRLARVGFEVPGPHQSLLCASFPWWLLPSPLSPSASTQISRANKRKHAKESTVGLSLMCHDSFFFYLYIHMEKAQMMEKKIKAHRLREGNQLFWENPLTSKRTYFWRPKVLSPAHSLT